MVHRHLRPLNFLIAVTLLTGCQTNTGLFEVSSFGAKGDGHHLDTHAVNKAIDAAAKAGGGTVHFGPGTYLCYSIHLQSNVSLYLETGATIKAAGTATHGQYDAPEPNESNHYQDFGHTHFHNSLIWGENIHDAAILGPGLIDGENALSRGWSFGTTKPAEEIWIESPDDDDSDDSDSDEPTTQGSNALLMGAGQTDMSAPNPSTIPTTQPSTRWWSGHWRLWTPPSPDMPTDDYQAEFATTQPTSEPSTQPATHPDYPTEKDTLASGIANKAIAIRGAHHVVIRDVSIYEGGHFGILATAVDGLTIDNVKIDTNRDGMDIDCCRDVHVSNCSVNSPHDDGICLKSSYALGYVRDTQNVTIANCYVTGGYREGSLLDGTFHRLTPEDTKGNHYNRTGRIKLGTESNGGFKNIAISNCILDDCEGLAIESVDGGVVENVAVSNLIIRDCTSAPIFIRLGSRLRGPKETTTVGAIRHINISDVIAQSLAQRYAVILSGIPGAEIEDVHLHNICLSYPGGGIQEWADRAPPEKVKGYPDPTMFGGINAYGFFIRHINGLELTNVSMSTAQPDARPPIIAKDVQHFSLDRVTADHPHDVPMLKLRDVTDLSTQQVQGVENTHTDDVEAHDF
jgi:polygalacturonase